MVVEQEHKAGQLSLVCSTETLNQWSLEDFPLSFCRSPTINDQELESVRSPPDRMLNYQP